MRCVFSKSGIDKHSLYINAHSQSRWWETHTWSSYFPVISSFVCCVWSLPVAYLRSSSPLWRIWVLVLSGRNAPRALETRNHWSPECSCEDSAPVNTQTWGDVMKMQIQHCWTLANKRGCLLVKLDSYKCIYRVSAVILIPQRIKFKANFIVQNLQK